jgi:TetR/AcrR family transcriptional regulator, regulator of autoinduction and epiphytic fitness
MRAAAGSQDDPRVAPLRSVTGQHPGWALLGYLEPALGARETSRLREDLAKFEPEAEPADGRVARSRRSRQAIIDAMRELHADGELRPTAPRVAERAGVSLRTVWEHFDDMESLMVEAARSDLELVLRLLRPIRGDQPLADRISQFTAQRARILEQMTPSWRAARVREPFSPQLQRSKKRMLRLAAAELETVFAAELLRLPAGRRAELIRALQAVSLWSFWESLRTELGLSPVGARATIATAFSALFAQAGLTDSPERDADPS